MRKNILFIYSRMVIGGSTTSLLSLLNLFDYDQYNVDLILYSNDGELQNQINTNVNILEPMIQRRTVCKKIWNIFYWIDLIKARRYSKKYQNRLINSQYMAKYEAMACESISKEYDVAISFLEFWPMEFLVAKISAKRKIGWLHFDIKEAGLLLNVNFETYQKLDRIVLVSNSCVDNFKLMYPNLSEKVVCIENILSSNTIRNMSNQKSNPSPLVGDVIFVSVCRIVFASKGLDRGINAFERLKKEGYIGSEYKWYIIGDGLDFHVLHDMVKEKNLQENVILLGSKNNPYCIEKEAHIFLLPSRYEGKPMAVTEAQMLGLVPVVCEYSSAKEQISNGIDGIIVKNNDYDIYNVLKEIVLHKVDIQKMKNRILLKDYTNIKDIEKLYDLFE